MLAALKYCGQYKKNIIIALLLIMISVPIGVIPYFLVSGLITDYLGGSATLTGLLITCLLVLVCFAARYILYGLGLGQSHEGAYGTLLNIRTKLAHDLTRQPLGEVIDGGTGKYKKGFVEEINRIELLLAHMIPEGIPNLVTPILIIVILFFVDWRMGLLSLGSIPFGVIGMGAMMKIGIKGMPAYYAAATRLNSSIVEYVSGMEVIKIFGQTTESYKRYADTVDDYKKFTLAWYKECWLYMSFVGAGLPCTLLLTLPVGALFYFNGSLSLDTWILVMMLDLGMAIPLTRAMTFLPAFPQVNYTLQKVEALFDKPDVQSGDMNILPERFDVRFDDVTFAYHEKDVLKNVSFEAKQDTLTALVGESGSGKSTLARLLVHYWDVNSGNVFIGGRDIREYSFAALMSMTSYVEQDNFLFKGSIADNIRMGKQDATDEEVTNAAKAAACHEFIMKLPDGYDSDVGGLGGKLSGGEKQRITIARAILKNAPIIILDEATAFADAENEDLIQAAIGNLTKGKTVIVIAHRLSSITAADGIVVLDDGRVDSIGTHEELLQHSGVYQKLWRMSEMAEGWSLDVKETGENA